MHPVAPVRAARLRARSQFWALGCLIFELLVGTGPFAGGTAEEVVRRIVHGGPYPVRQDHPNGGLSAPARACIDRLLDHDVELRPGSVQALRGLPFFAGVEWETLGSQPPPFTHRLFESFDPAADAGRAPAS